MVSDSGGVQMPISASCTGQYLKEEAAYQLKKEEWYQLMKCRIRYLCDFYFFILYFILSAQKTTKVFFPSGERGWLSTRASVLVIKRSQVRVPAGVAGKFSSRWSTLCAKSYFGIRSTPVLPQ